jgi:hypothetical protein
MDHSCAKCGGIEFISKEVDGDVGLVCANCIKIKSEEAKIKLNEMYYEIIELLGDWLDIPEEHKKIISIWIIGTYFHKKFSTFPYLFLNAMRGSGKTRLLAIISWLQANGTGQVLTNPSDAVIFRTAKERGLVFDEFESEKSKDKQSMREYLNACYKKGGIVYRMEKQKNKEGKEEQVAVGHLLYTPVAMANINGIEDVLADRSISLILEKSMNDYLVRKIEDFGENTTIKSIKANLSRFSVELCSVEYEIKAWNEYLKRRYSTSLHTIHTIHNSTQLYTNTTNFEEEELFNQIVDTGIIGRNLELFFPLMMVARTLHKNVFEEIRNITIHLNANKKEDEFAESKDVTLIEFVSLADRFRFEMVYTHELFSEFKNFLGNQGNDEESKWLNITWFGLALKRLKLISDRKRVAKGQMILLNIDNAKLKIKLFKKDVGEE